MAISTADPSAPLPPTALPSPRQPPPLRPDGDAVTLALALIHGAILARQSRLAAEIQPAFTAQSVAQRLRSHIAQHRQAVIALARLIATDQGFTARHLATGARSR